MSKRSEAKANQIAEQAEQEWRKWHDLCDALHDAGAVTHDDLHRPVGDLSTAGGRLLEAIKEWARLRAKLEAAESMVEKEIGWATEGEFSARVVARPDPGDIREEQGYPHEAETSA